MNREKFQEPEMRTCIACNDRRPIDQMESFDISREDEYYPRLRYLCGFCSSESDGPAETGTGR